MKKSGEKGFTLVEVIVVAAIIAILAGILVPMIFSQIDEAKISRAKADIRSMSTAIYAFRKDVGTWPQNVTAACNSTMLSTSGSSFSSRLVNDFEETGFDRTNTKTFDSQIMDDPACYNNWNGPYMGGAGLDPWGNPYIMSTVNINDANVPIMILSAGPDGSLATNVADTSVSGDDIGIRLK